MGNEKYGIARKRIASSCRDEKKILQYGEDISVG
jgi:hypothetical protein